MQFAPDRHQKTFCVQLIHFPQSPGYFFAVPTHHWTLVAFFAESHAGVLAVLLDVVGV